MVHLESVFKSNFLEYASYVIKDRAIPHVDDGLKPVQRRILHTLFEMDNGSFHKVANVVGACMKYHPHGDASIGPALVVLANKDLFIEKQGNFGNLFTGDVAAAGRYIECRLTPLAREGLFMPAITRYELSYDGRNREPVVLPAKLPVLLAQGAEGIAVGMATKILPHNLIELLEAEIKALRKQKFAVYPDFPTGGEMDVGEYADGNGKVLVRAKLDTSDPKRIVVRELPFGVTTEGLIASIEAAARRNRVKVAQIHDFTTSEVEVEIRLPRGVYAADVVDALFAFTDCEVVISTNLLVIRDNRPEIMNVTDVVKHNAARLVEILTAELKIEADALRDKLHAKTLEQIFIENRIYKRIEQQKTAPAVVKAVLDGLKPFRKQIKRVVTDEDVATLLKIPIRRISLYDINKAADEMKEIRKRLREIKSSLGNIVEYTITFLRAMIDKYRDRYPRRTTISSLDHIDAREAARRDLKLRYDGATGYLGTNISGGKAMLDVSHYDRVLVIRKDGTYSVVDAPDRLFVGKGMLYCGFVDKDVVFNVLYKQKDTGYPYIKRCRIDKFILNRAYPLVPKGATVVSLTTADNVAADLAYTRKPRMRILNETFQVGDYAIRGNKARGLRLSTRQLSRGKFVPVAN
ncbi:MAG: DNA topoisomerase IV subunit A [Planctomycetes bacterium]|nr:DNA topoisomerase IV subunit A [Planctomycetota bacterium]